MKRNILLGLLDRYIPTSQEIEFKNTIRSFIEHHPDCFERTLMCGHITASCWLINKNNTHALLTHHAKLEQWFQLGGHCDGHADVLAVALKEAQEESGIQNIVPVSPEIFDIDVHLIPANKKEGAHYHYDIRFLLQVTTHEESVKSEESKELRWIEKDSRNLPTANPAVVRLFNKWLNLDKKLR